MDTATFQDMWKTRPARSREQLMIAGVCSGFAARYRVDATLVRVAFVVSSVFGGVGVVFYFLGIWLLPSDPWAPPKRPRRDPTYATDKHFLKWLPAVIIGFIILSSVGGGHSVWNGSGLASAALMLIGWWLLYQRTPVPPQNTSADQVKPWVAPPTPTSNVTSAGYPVIYGHVAPSAQPTQTMQSTAASGADLPPVNGPEAPADGTAPRPEAATDRIDPPSWDPLGAARFAWDLPEPTAPVQPPAPKVPRSRLTSVFAGLAILAASGATAARVVGIEWFTVGRIASIALAVLGVGLIVAALERRPSGSRASGLVPLATMAGVVAVVATLLAGHQPNFPSGGIGERTWAPTTATDLRDTYDLTVGNTNLDLSKITALDRDRTVSINQGVGEVRVTLPHGIRVKTNCHTALGDQTCPDGVVNPDAKTPTLTVNADLTVGNVEMK